MAGYKKTIATTQWQQDEKKEMNLRNIQVVVLTGPRDCLMWKMRKNDKSENEISIIRNWIHWVRK